MKTDLFQSCGHCWVFQICWHNNRLTAAAKSRQSCLTLCDPIDGRPTGSSVPGILQARILEWVAISFSHAWRWKVKVKSLSCVRLLATPWTVAYQAPPSVGFSRQEYWSGSPLPSPVVLWPRINNLNITMKDHQRKANWGNSIEKRRWQETAFYKNVHL